MPTMRQTQHGNAEHSMSTFPAYFLEQAPAWAAGYKTWQVEPITPVRRVGYSLRELAQSELINPFRFEAFRSVTGLEDFSWRLFWADTDGLPDDQSIAEIIRAA